jgi:hypothetical protein
MAKGYICSDHSGLAALKEAYSKPFPDRCERSGIRAIVFLFFSTSTAVEVMSIPVALALG